MFDYCFFYMLRRLSPEKIKIIVQGNQMLHLFKPEFQSVLYNKVNTVDSVFLVNYVGKIL